MINMNAMTLGMVSDRIESTAPVTLMNSAALAGFIPEIAAN